MKQLTDAQLDELARLEAGATPAPWIDEGGYRCRLEDGRLLFETKHNDVSNYTDSEFVAAARNALPALLAELRLLRKVGAAIDHDTGNHDSEVEMGNAVFAWRQWKRGAK